MRILERAEAAGDRALAELRRRSRGVDHLWRAMERLADVLAGRLAAAISYYGFFAAFALTVVVYSLLGRLHSQATDGILSEIYDYLADTLPWVIDTAEQVGYGEVTLVGGVALLVAGVGWVEALRSSQRAIWQLDQHPGNWVIRWLIDLGMLLALGVLLVLSLAMTAALDGALDWLAPNTDLGQTLLRSSGPVFELFLDLILATAVLAAVPRLRLSPRRLIPPALVVTAGIFLLNTAGRWFVALSESRPAYRLVASTVGLLIYLYLFNQLILLGAALAATAHSGTVVDLAAGPPPSRLRPVGDEPANASATDIGEPREPVPAERR